MALTNPGFYSGESMVINPVFSGIIDNLHASDFGLSYDKLFPKRTFRSAGNGMGQHMRYNLSDSLREVDDELLIRRPATPAFSISRSRSYEPFRVRRRHLDAAVNDEEAQLIKDQTQGLDDPHVTEVKWVREVMLLAKERRAAKFASDIKNVGTNKAPAVAWDQPDADPIADITTMRMLVKAKSGLFPDHMALPYEVALKLAMSPKIRGMRGNTERGYVNQSELADLLKDVLALKEVVIFTAMFNATRPSVTPTLDLNSIWGPNVYLYSVPASVGLDSLCWGLEIVDTYYGGDDGFNAPAYTIPLPDSEVTKYRIKEDSDFVLFNKEVAGALRNVISLPIGPGNLTSGE